MVGEGQLKTDAGANGGSGVEPLGDNTTSRPLGVGLLVLLVIIGATLVTLLVFTVGSIERAPRRGHDATRVPPDLMAQAVAAYERADWDEAARLFEQIRELGPKSVRTEYFLTRIELTRKDAETLARAEEALVAGEVERAKPLALEVAPNSPLFAQAESFLRGAAKAAQEQVRAKSAEPAGKLSAEVRVALGEALALYEAGKFEEATQRARELAARGTGSVQTELLGWARDAEAFAPLQRALSADDQALLGQLDTVERAVALDLRLSEGHYARVLKLRAGRALAAQSSELYHQGRLFDACAAFVRATQFSSQERASVGLERRCENEAMRRLGQARAIEARTPSAAKALYEQVRLLSLPGNSAYRAAEAALGGAHANGASRAL